MRPAATCNLYNSLMDIIRPYRQADEAACLRLFDGNTPAFFSPDERDDFRRFLGAHALDWHYQVIEREGRIVACGGHAIGRDGESAEFCWGMVDRGLQRTGLGRLLTRARLRAARAVPGVRRIRLDTSQHTQGFYARFGFEVERVVPDGYDAGLDRWEMVLVLDAASSSPDAG